MAALVRRELSSGHPGSDHITLPALVSGTDHSLAPIEDKVVFAGSHLPRAGRPPAGLSMFFPRRLPDAGLASVRGRGKPDVRSAER